MQKRRRRARLADLPEFGLFYAAASGRRGILLSWHYKERQRWSAQVYLLGNEHTGPTRKWMRAEQEVLLDESDDAVNVDHRRGDTGDQFHGRWQFIDIDERRPAQRARRERDSGVLTELEKWERNTTFWPLRRRS